MPLLLCLLLATCATAAESTVRDVAELDAAVKAARPGDVIVMADGMWTDADLLFRGRGTAEAPIVLRAQTPGKVVLTGASSLRLAGSWLLVDGLCFRDGRPRRGSVVEFRADSKTLADHCRLTNCAIINVNPDDPTIDSKWISLHGQDNRVDHCYLAGKSNLGTTLVVWLADQPNRHRIDHNHFGARPRLRVNGGETIRVGTSDWSMHESQTLVESNWFESCNGEVEIISSKSCGNIYRANTFFRCEGALTLRHGNRCRVEGNAFLGGEARLTGGVRVIGEDHLVANNLFAGLRGDGSRAALSIMQGIPNSPLSGYFQVKRATIAHNTFVDNASTLEVGLPGSGTSLPPEDCRFVNNLLRGEAPLIKLLMPGVRMHWGGNLVEGPLGAELPGFRALGLCLELADNLWRPAAASPAVDAAVEEVPGVSVDIEGQPRIGARDVGCDERSTAPLGLRPVGRDETGPAWLPRP